MARFRDVKTLQKFAAAHASIHNHFNQARLRVASAFPTYFPPEHLELGGKRRDALKRFHAGSLTTQFIKRRNGMGRDGH
jgi:hypothetical protein